MSLPDRPFGEATAATTGNDVHRRGFGRKHSLTGGEKGHGEGVHDQNSADDLLEAMGYQAELVRNRSTLQVVFMSFVLASIPYGLATTFFYPLVGGGPANIVWGWVTVSFIILCVALSLGEITSVYPTAGGVYYQTFMLAPPSYRKIASWICGWAFVVGNITITLAVNFGTTLFFVACINVFGSTEEVPDAGIFPATTYQIFLIFVAITFLCNAVSAFGNKYLPLLDVCAVSSLCVPTAYVHRLSPSSGLLQG
jgi:amino acid transporter